MRVSDLHSDEALRQREFPVTRRRVYLAHAGVCPLPRRVVEAVQAAAGVGAEDDQESAFRGGFIEETRLRAARLLGARAEEIALMGPTSMGLSTVAAGLPLRKGDNILVYLDDYPSNVYPWMALADRGIEVRLLNIRHLGRIRNVDVLGQVDEQTRLVALASCHFLSGFRIDVDGLGRALRGRGIWFCVDAIQTLGAFPTRVEQVDFLAADSHKWMLGPSAAGLLYVRRELQDLLRPWAFGWHNVRCPNFITQEDLVLRRDARRYEAGSQNLLGLVGLRAALELVEELGVDGIAADLAAKRSWLVERLTARGCEVLEPDPGPVHASGIVSFRPPGGDAEGLHTRLLAAGICASLRMERSGRQWVRFSPHYYNTEAELARAVEGI
jgi:cysteine desulfurase / selenocysteine lyase